MSAEGRAKIERLALIYENRVLVTIVLVAVITSACLSLLAMKSVSSDKFDPAKGDRAVITYEATYYGKPVTQVAIWVDKDDVTRYATETPRWAGIEVPILILVLVNVGLAKAGYDTYQFLTGRYRRRLTASL